MDFTYPAEVEAFREEFRAWLDANLDDESRGLTYSAEPGEVWVTAMRRWNAKLADAGYAAISWPVEYGGRGAGLLEQVVLSEELARADAPATINVIGISNIAPAMMQFGTEQQKRRFLPRMLRGDDIWCQGFSEPDAGSDLASLRATAVRDGDVYVVNGQKVWTTLAHVADWCELLVRTDPDAKKHKGISCLLVDMTLPGIEVRPLVTITGEREFNEVFFDDVRVPADAARRRERRLDGRHGHAHQRARRGGQPSPERAQEDPALARTGRRHRDRRPARDGQSGRAPGAGPHLRAR